MFARNTYICVYEITPKYRSQIDFFMFWPQIVTTPLDVSDDFSKNQKDAKTSSQSTILKTSKNRYRGIRSSIYLHCYSTLQKPKSK